MEFLLHHTVSDLFWKEIVEPPVYVDTLQDTANHCLQQVYSSNTAAGYGIEQLVTNSLYEFISALLSWNYAI